MRIRPGIRPIASGDATVADRCGRVTLASMPCYDSGGGDGGGGGGDDDDDDDGCGRWLAMGTVLFLDAMRTPDFIVLQVTVV